MVKKISKPEKTKGQNKAKRKERIFHFSLVGLVVAMACILQIQWVGNSSKSIKSFFGPPHVETVQCPVCTGAGEIYWNIDNTSFIDCPACFGTGGRLVKIVPKKTQLCPHCKGMGQTIDEQQHRHPCRICTTRGTVRQL